LGRPKEGSHGELPLQIPDYQPLTYKTTRVFITKLNIYIYIYIFIYIYIDSFLGRPKEGSHGELPLLGDISSDRQAVLIQEAVKLPLRHALVVTLFEPRIVQRHLEAAAAAVSLAPLLLPIWPEHPGHGGITTVGATNSTHPLLFLTAS
jgi:hypothetical protein